MWQLSIYDNVHCVYIYVVGRWEALGAELFTVCDRTKTNHCLAPVCIVSSASPLPFYLFLRHCISYCESSCILLYVTIEMKHSKLDDICVVDLQCHMLI